MLNLMGALMLGKVFWYFFLFLLLFRENIPDGWKVKDEESQSEECSWIGLRFLELIFSYICVIKPKRDGRIRDGMGHR